MVSTEVMSEASLLFLERADVRDPSVQTFQASLFRIIIYVFTIKHIQLQRTLREKLLSFHVVNFYKFEKLNEGPILTLEVLNMGSLLKRTLVKFEDLPSEVIKMKSNVS